MRTPKNWLLAICVVLSAALYYSFNCGTPCAYLTINDTSAGAQFVLHDLPDYSHLDADSNGRFLVFVNTGDGNYFQETVTYAQVRAAAQTQGSSIVLNRYHQYTQSQIQNQTYHPYAELTPVYGDTDPPPFRVAGNQGSTINFAPNNTFTAFNGCTFNGWVKIEANRKIVSGDSITYMVTYQNRTATGGGLCPAEVSGNITIKYDASKMTYRGTGTFLGETFNSTTQSTTLGNTVKFDYTGLEPDSQRTIFFIFEAADNLVVNSSLNPITEVTFSYNRHGAGEPCNSSSTIPHPASSQVADAHDPNEKNVLENGLCNGDDFVKWRIDFQNEGNAPEDSVIIVDWIDTLLDFNSVQLVNSKFPVTATTWDPQKREVRFIMDNIVLNGLKEYGIDESLTRGYITLKAKKREAVNMPCNAIVNRARIHFKCKPPIVTEDAIAPFACDSLCAPCTVVFDTTLTAKVRDTVITIFSASEQSSALYSLLSSAQYVKWYPSDGLSNPLVLNPTVVKPYKRTYTLVASTSDTSTTPCQRIIVRVPIKSAAELKMFPLAAPTSGCPDHPLWKVTAQAFGASSAANLIWHDCTAGTDTWTSSATNMTPYQTVYVGVWDTETECTAEAWIPLEGECITIDGCRNYRYSLAVFAVAILGFLLYKIFKKVKLAGK